MGEAIQHEVSPDWDSCLSLERSEDQWLQWVIWAPNSAGHPAPAPSPITGRRVAGTCGKRGSQHQNSHPKACDSKLEATLKSLFFPSGQKKLSSAITHTTPVCSKWNCEVQTCFLVDSSVIWLGSTCFSCTYPFRFYLSFQKAQAREWVSERRNSKSSPSATNQN